MGWLVSVTVSVGERADHPHLLWKVPLQTRGVRQTLVHVSSAVSLLGVAEVEAVRGEDVLHRTDT